MKRLFCLFIFLTAFLNAFGQRKIQGKVTDAKDLPLPGVSVSIKGTAMATSTNSNGVFEISIDDSLQRKNRPIILLVAFIGYTATEIQINNISTDSITIKLKDNGSSLNEVVVIGYGTTRKLEPAENVSFPWPPPDFSTRTLLDRTFFVDSKKLEDVDDILVKALNHLKYSERAYFYIPNGFALVTRIEQINENGESLPPPDRWSVKTKSMTKLSWYSYIKTLFFSTPGYFRIIVFIVTNKPFTSSGKKINNSTASNWLNSGLNVLPEKIKRKKFSSDYNCTALIYEFKKPESKEAYLLTPSSITADDHLQKSKIMDALKKR